LQDIDRGTPLEIDETLGFALRRGRELGIPMPTLEMSYRLIKTGR
jgi:ketopantoate reductase